MTSPTITGSPALYPELITDTSINVRRPVGYVSIDLAGTSLNGYTIRKVLALSINGVNAVKYLGARVSSDGEKVFVDNPFYDSELNICFVFVASNGTTNVTTGYTWTGKAGWDGKLPLVYQPYRDYGSKFQPGTFILNKLSNIWRQHDDTAIIQEMLGSIYDAGYEKHVNAVFVRNTDLIQWVEPVDRARIAVANFDGPTAPETIYSDIVTLYNPENGWEKYSWMRDYFINVDKIPVFFSHRNPAFVKAAGSYVNAGVPASRPTTGFSKFCHAYTASGKDTVVYLDAESAVTGFDFCIIPPGVISAPSAMPDSIFAVVSKTGGVYRVYDKQSNPEGFIGSVTFDSPVQLGAEDNIRFYQVSGATINDAADISLTFRRKIALIGPDAHIQNSRIAKFFGLLTPLHLNSNRINDKIKAAACLGARMDKSSAALERYISAILEIPMCPFPGGIVNFLTDPDPTGVHDGQIDIWGAVQEYHRTPEFSVAAGDTCDFLQVLVDREIEGVKIVDYDVDPSFMVQRTYTNGVLTAKTINPACVDYVRSKAVGAITVPDAYGGDQELAAAEILESTSFKIRLGRYASERIARNAALVDDIFKAVNAVKPSGSDYWIELSDGSAITKSTGVTSEIDVSNYEGYEAGHGYRIFQEDNYAKGQYPSAWLGINRGAPKVGDVISYTVLGGGPLTSLSETITDADFSLNNLYPADEAFKRMTAAINANSATHKMTATFVEGSKNTWQKVRVYPNATKWFNVNQAATIFQGDINPNLTLEVYPPPGANEYIALGRDPSRIFQSAADAQGVLQSYVEYNVASYDIGGGDVPINVEDEGQGPFDSTTVKIPLVGISSINFKSDPFTVGSDVKWGRVRLSGVCNLAGNVDGRYSVWASTQGATIPAGTVVTLTFTNGGLATPVSISETVASYDESNFAFLGRLLGKAANDSRLAAILKFQYPSGATIYGAPASTQYEIVPLNPQAATTLELLFSDDAADAYVGRFVLNATTMSSGVPFLYSSIAPNEEVIATAAFTIGGRLYYSNSVKIAFPDEIGGSHFFSLDLFFEPLDITPGANQLSVDVQFSYNGSGSRTYLTFEARFLEFTINAYPEFSKDSDQWSLFDYENPAGSAGAIKTPNQPTWNATFYPNRATLGQQNPIDFPSLSVGEVDVTTRLIKPGEAIIERNESDFGQQLCYLSGTFPVVAGSYNLRQDYYASVFGAAATNQPVKVLNERGSCTITVGGPAVAAGQSFYLFFEGVSSPVVYTTLVPAETANTIATGLRSAILARTSDIYGVVVQSGTVTSPSGGAFTMYSEAVGSGSVFSVKPVSYPAATPLVTSTNFVGYDNPLVLYRYCTPIDVRTASTAALSVIYSGGDTLTATANGTLIADDVPMAVGDIMLIKDQATPAQNGIYEVFSKGSSSTPWVLKRTATSIVNGLSPLVAVGTVNANTRWICNDVTGPLFVSIPVELKYDVRPAGQTNYVFARLGSADFSMSGTNPTSITIPSTSAALGAASGTVWGYCKPAEDTEMYGSPGSVKLTYTNELNPAQWFKYRFSDIYPLGITNDINDPAQQDRFALDDDSYQVYENFEIG